MPSTLYKIAGAGTGTDWLAPGNITAKDDTGSIFAIPVAGESEFLISTSHGITGIPNNHFIRGYEVRVRHISNGTKVNLSDAFIRHGGAAVGQSRGLSGFVDTSWEDVVIGTPFDNWNAGLAPESINGDITFGVQIKYANLDFSFSRAIQVDSIEIKVWHFPRPVIEGGAGPPRSRISRLIRP